MIKIYYWYQVIELTQIVSYNWSFVLSAILSILKVFWAFKSIFELLRAFLSISRAFLSFQELLLIHVNFEWWAFWDFRKLFWTFQKLLSFWKALFWMVTRHGAVWAFWSFSRAFNELYFECRKDMRGNYRSQYLIN